MVDGDNCGLLCVERSIGCAVEGAWYGLWWVWLERCRDGSYAVNALHCDVWVVCAYITYSVHCRLFHWILGKCFWWKCIPT